MPKMQTTKAKGMFTPLECHYVMPTTPKPGQARTYIKALEDRVAELEMLLTQNGNIAVSHDHWNEGPEELESDEQEDIQPLLNAVRDLSLDVAGSYVGGASTITLGRALGTALAGKLQFVVPEVGAQRENARPLRTSSIASEVSSLPSGNGFHISQVHDDAAERMVKGYLGHLCTNFPIMYSYSVVELNNRRHNLKDIYEESILNLIYGLGGHFLEKVRELVFPLLLLPSFLAGRLASLF
jgi:hypothetical protein